MKKIILLILSLALVLSLGVCTFADNDSFDPTLDIVKSDDGKTITVTMNDLPDGIAAELTIPCIGWDDATVKDSAGKTVSSSFDKTADAVTFDAKGGTYVITKKSIPTDNGYDPVVTPDEDKEEKPVEPKPVVKPVTPPAQEPVAPAPEDTAPEVKPDAPVVDEPVVDEAPVVDTEPSGNAGLWIGIGIVALAAIVVVLVVMAARKKRKL